MDIPMSILSDRAERAAWCSAVSYAKSVRKRVNKAEKLRIDVDAAAVQLSMSGLTARQLRLKASMHYRYGEWCDCLVSVRAAIKAARRES